MLSLVYHHHQLINHEYSYNDIVNGNITTRTLYSDNSLEHISFGWWDDDNNPTDRSLSLLEVNYLNIDTLTSASCMFYNCTNLTHVKTSNWDTSNVLYSKDMQYMFSGCNSLVSLIIGDVTQEQYDWWYRRLSDASIQNNVTITYNII